MHEKHKFLYYRFVSNPLIIVCYFKVKIVNYCLQFLLAGLKGQTDFDFKHVNHLENIEDPCKQSLHFDQIEQSSHRTNMQ